MSLFGKEEKPISVEIKGQILKCVICGHGTFVRRTSYFAEYAAVLRLNSSRNAALCYVCYRCGYVHWFLPR